MKFIAIAYRDPSQSVRVEQHEADTTKVRRDGEYLIVHKDGADVKWIPNHNVELVEFFEPEEPTGLVLPGGQP